VIITNHSWTWASAARKAHALSECNPDMTFYVCVPRDDGVIFITDRIDCRHLTLVCGGEVSAHRNGQRV